jgi:hypothetical protein
MGPDDPRDDEDEGDQLEAEIMRADHTFGSDLRGTTPEEALAGQSLDDALARERPDREATDEAVAVADDGDPDDEAELVAEGSITRDEFTSPEDSAVSIRDDAPGATDHADPHHDEA